VKEIFKNKLEVKEAIERGGVISEEIGSREDSFRDGRGEEQSQNE
jgi:hypothetical protein